MGTSSCLSALVQYSHEHTYSPCHDQGRQLRGGHTFRLAPLCLSVYTCTSKLLACVCTCTHKCTHTYMHTSHTRAHTTYKHIHHSTHTAHTHMHTRIHINTQTHKHPHPPTPTHMYTPTPTHPHPPTPTHTLMYDYEEVLIVNSLPANFFASQSLC